ncbi:hypothetical protein [Geitlerinema sp. PCC 9228]|jgi:hypothetical protein|uniref:hypothetical protein n=1 Tax=Geitlerinema sp. PCC 9228 TaxID=111611 RepID=UPI0008F9CDD9|nr:hypothetical protein [Geitlerinema sp. PCC 9228]
MKYIFEMIGISSVLHFFNEQQSLRKNKKTGIEYIGSYECSLDAFLRTIDNISQGKDWDMNLVRQATINYWMQNPEQVSFWKARLDDAGAENLLVAKVGDLPSLRAELENLL